MSEWPTARGMELVKYEMLGYEDFILVLEIDLKRGFLARLLRRKPATMAIAFRGGATVWHYYPSGRRAESWAEHALSDFWQWIEWEGKDSDHKYVPGFPTIKRSEVPPPPPRKKKS